MNAWQIKARSFARKIGVIRLMNLVRPAGSYEARVNQALAGAVQPGDVVWDVGANVGVYTELFCTWVGDTGSVVAFEPFPQSCEQIRQRIPGCPWLRIENVALGETDTTSMLVTGSDSTQNHLAGESDSPSLPGAVPVTVRRGDTAARDLARVPNVLKIDVEGFEEEVLAGLSDTLRSQALRSVLVEVHFKKLEDRGRLTAPMRIEMLLGTSGFSTRWVDASHLFATR